MASQTPNKNMSKSEYKTTKKKEDCTICADEVSSKKIVRCPFCTFSACDKCTTRFLMSIDDDRPRCMNPECKKVWTYEFLADSFDMSFHNKRYRDRRADLLLQQQKALLPASQYLVEQRKRVQEDHDNIQDLLEENAMLKLLIKRNNNKIYDIRGRGREVTEVEEKRQFTRSCPRNNCRGFLSTALKCGTCEEWACKDCHEPKNGKDDTDHKCDPNTVATVKLLTGDTKQCPSCATAIFKIEGCDQMYCTQCHTAFSWINGTIERGVIHNPHYYAFQREQNGGVAPRVAGDIRCGGLPPMHSVYSSLQRIKSGLDCYQIHRLMTHIQHVEIPRYPVTITDTYLQDMRVNYLIGLINEEKWLKNLKEKNKKQEKNTAVNQVLTMFTATIGDIFGNITSCNNLKELKNHVESLELLREFTNKALAKIGYRFGNVVPTITKDWSFVSNSKNTVKTVKTVPIEQKYYFSDTDDEY